MRTASSQKGFTLIELAISLMVIGLLIGGVLKGQELMTNARTARTMKSLESYESATVMFQSLYGNQQEMDRIWPGDIQRSLAMTLFPNCGLTNVACHGYGNKNGLVIMNSFGGDESRAFWYQLTAANLVSGYNHDLDSATAGTEAYLKALPQAALSGTAFKFEFVGPTAYAAPYVFQGGNVFHLIPNSTAGTALGGAIHPRAAIRIDKKLDDGNPYTGHIIAVNTVTPTNCITSAGAYAEGVAAGKCNLVIKPKM